MEEDIFATDSIFYQQTTTKEASCENEVMLLQQVKTGKKTIPQEYFSRNIMSKLHSRVFIVIVHQL